MTACVSVLGAAPSSILLVFSLSAALVLRRTRGAAAGNTATPFGRTTASDGSRATSWIDSTRIPRRSASGRSRSTTCLAAASFAPALCRRTRAEASRSAPTCAAMLATWCTRSVHVVAEVLRHQTPNSPHHGAARRNERDGRLRATWGSPRSPVDTAASHSSGHHHPSGTALSSASTHLASLINTGCRRRYTTGSLTISKVCARSAARAAVEVRAAAGLDWSSTTITIRAPFAACCVRTATRHLDGSAMTRYFYGSRPSTPSVKAGSRAARSVCQ